MRNDPLPTGAQPVYAIPHEDGYAIVMAFVAPRLPVHYPYRAFLPGWRSLSRTIVLLDGETPEVRAAHFVCKPREKQALWKRGLLDVTDRWRVTQALAAQVTDQPHELLAQLAKALRHPADMPQDLVDRLQQIAEARAAGEGGPDQDEGASDAPSSPEAPGQDAPTEEAPATDPWTLERIGAAGYRELQAALKERDLPAAGSYGDLRARLAEALGLGG